VWPLFPPSTSTSEVHKKLEGLSLSWSGLILVPNPDQCRVVLWIFKP
jgi:hypothetical protein